MTRETGSRCPSSESTIVARRVQTDRMSGADKRVNAFDDLHRVIEIARAIDSQHRAQLLAGKWMLRADALSSTINALGFARRRLQGLRARRSLRPIGR